MLDKVQLKLMSLSEILGNPDVGILMLSDMDEKTQLPIVCDAAIRDDIRRRLAKDKVCNTMLPEILTNILVHQYGFHFEVVINDVIDGVYRAMVVNTDTYEPISIRATDAILLHVISKCPLYATTGLLQRQSIPLVKGSPTMALPYNILSDRMLHDAMRAAVDAERYEMASTIRDELKKRGKL